VVSSGLGGAGGGRAPREQAYIVPLGHFGPAGAERRAGIALGDLGGMGVERGARDAGRAMGDVGWLRLAVLGRTPNRARVRHAGRCGWCWVPGGLQGEVVSLSVEGRAGSKQCAQTNAEAFASHRAKVTPPSQARRSPEGRVIRGCGRGCAVGVMQRLARVRGGIVVGAWVVGYRGTV